VVNHRDVGNHRRGNLVHFLQEVRIKILRPVRKKHHEGHKNDKIGKTLPFSRDDTQNLPGARGAMLLPRFRLRHFRADVQREKRRQRTDPEHGAPSPCRQEKSRGNRGEQVADGITALQNPAEDSPPAHWRCFHRERRAPSPLAAPPPPERPRLYHLARAVRPRHRRRSCSSCCARDARTPSALPSTPHPPSAP